MPDDDRRARGLARYREVYGDDAVTFEEGQFAFFDLMMEHVFDGVWNRPGLDVPQRRLLTMGVLAAQHHFDTLRLQFERCLDTGELDEDQVREVVVHLVPYVGYPSSGALFGAGEAAIAAHRRVGGRPMSATGHPACAVVGLGRMGGPMADNALAAGLRVAVHDVDPNTVEPRRAAGATVAPTPAAAAEGATVVAVVVFDDVQVRSVVAGPDGLLTTLGPGAVVLVHTTVSLDTIDELGELGDRRGVHVVDAGVSGGEPGARAGTLVTMVGGEAAAIDAARPLLDAYSREVVHAGPRGAGMALKLARNAAGYTLMAAAHEALLLAVGAGVEPEVLRHVMEATDLPGMLYTPFTLGGPEPLGADAPEGLRRAMAHTARLGDKDVGQALALARRLGVDLPTLAAVRHELPATVRLPR